MVKFFAFLQKLEWELTGEDDHVGRNNYAVLEGPLTTNYFLFSKMR